MYYFIKTCTTGKLPLSFKGSLYIVYLRLLIRFVVVDGAEFLKAKFIPKIFNLKSFGEVEIRVRKLRNIQVCH